MKEWAIRTNHESLDSAFNILAEVSGIRASDSRIKKLVYIAKTNYTFNFYLYVDDYGHYELSSVDYYNDHSSEFILVETYDYSNGTFRI